MSTKTEEDAKKRRTTDVYSDTYSKKSIKKPKSVFPAESIVPIKDGVYDPYAEGHKKWKKDQQTYNEMIRESLLNPENKNFNIDGKDFIGIAQIVSECCSNPKKQKNIVSKTLQFYICKNCGKDLGDIND